MKTSRVQARDAMGRDEPDLDMQRYFRSGALVSIGYMLSPLSWWNDVFFNLPIALVLGYGVSWLQPDWFFPGTIAGYWLSNVLGMVMMQLGATDLLMAEERRNPLRDTLIGCGGATLYTVVVTALVYFQVLEMPQFLTDLRP
jgi:hypothetical protein